MKFSDEPPVVHGWYWVYTARDKQTKFVYLDHTPNYWMEQRARDVSDAEFWVGSGECDELGDEFGEYEKDLGKIAKIEARPDSYYYTEYAGPVEHEAPMPTQFEKNDSRALYR